MSAPLLEVAGLGAGYGKVRVLWDVSLEVGPGEFVALIGPNGAGKSTLLNTICGLVPRQAGDVSFDGASIAGRAPHQIARLGIAHVPEGRRLFGPLTVHENLLAGWAFRARKGTRAELQELLERTFALFPVLQQRRRQRAETLSGGEQQMLAIARGLMSTPRLLLIDEPSFGLAPLVVRAVAETLRQVNEKHGMGILLVEQNARIAMSVAQRVYVLDRGRVALQGRSSELAGAERIRRYYTG